MRALAAVADDTHRGLSAGDWIAGKYRIESELGRGGMGFVYRAVQDELDRVVAIKVLRPELATSEEVTERMLREARAAARIQSEHAVRVLDFGKLDDGRPFIVMEYSKGETLAERLERGPLPLDEIVDSVCQAIAALAEAHAQGIVHRDLKPDNLFVSTRSSGETLLKVLDFGISKQLRAPTSASRLTNPSLTLGSPEYMSPEQIQTPDELDGRADIWSLGVVLFELGTGQTPFAGPSLGSVFGNVLAGVVRPPSELNPALPAAFDEVVFRCLQRQVSERFQSVTELADALQSLVGFDVDFGRVSRTGRRRRELPATVPAPAPRSAFEWTLKRRVLTASLGLVLGATGTLALWNSETPLMLEPSVKREHSTPSWIAGVPDMSTATMSILPSTSSPPARALSEEAPRRTQRRGGASSTAADNAATQPTTKDAPRPAQSEAFRPWDTTTFGGRL